MNRLRHATPLFAVVAALSAVPVIAQTWSTPLFIGNGAATASSTNGTGTSAVIFRQTAGAIQAAVEAGGTWSAPATLAASGLTATIAVAPNGDALAVWVFRTTNTYLPSSAQAAFYSGGHWGQTLTISSNMYGSVSGFDVPSIGFDGNSRATVIWEQLAAADGSSCALTAMTGIAAAGFGSSHAISNGKCYGWTGLAVNRGGQAVAVQGVPGILSGPVIAISRDLTGTWGAPVTLQASQYRQRQPRVDLGDDGTAVAVWTQHTTASYAVRSPSGVWSPAAALPGVSAISGTAFVAVDGNGNAVAAYSRYQLPAGLLTQYRPSGGTWQSPVLLESGGPVAATATAAGTFVVASGTAAYVRSAGSSTWKSTAFTNGVSSLGAASGSAVLSTGPQVSVSTAVVP